jgi:hypothetical protein
MLHFDWKASFPREHPLCRAACGCGSIFAAVKTRKHVKKAVSGTQKFDTAGAHSIK